MGSKKVSVFNFHVAKSLLKTSRVAYSKDC